MSGTPAEDPAVPSSPAPDRASSPRPRATRMPRALRRPQLMEAARAVFVELGYAGASMDQIAERAAVSKPVLYQHFSSKQELFLELLDAEVADVTGRLTQAMATPGDNRRRVHATVCAVFAYMGSPGRTHRLLFDSTATAHDVEVLARVEAVDSAVAAQVSRIIRDDTRVDEAEAEVLSRGIVAYVLGAARHWADRVDADRRPDVAGMAERVDALLWSGLSQLPTDHARLAS